mmetsp:Transcript_26288/g.78837  ORF Transcript_26288/g.78837 Transcript_26288/m.78837 type:complete len:350 (-) Transcript_26288:880-1929(-)
MDRERENRARPPPDFDKLDRPQWLHLRQASGIREPPGPPRVQTLPLLPQPLWALVGHGRPRGLFGRHGPLLPRDRGPARGQPRVLGLRRVRTQVPELGRGPGRRLHDLRRRRVRHVGRVQDQHVRQLLHPGRGRPRAPGRRPRGVERRRLRLLPAGLRGRHRRAGPRRRVRRRAPVPLRLPLHGPAARAGRPLRHGLGHPPSGVPRVRGARRGALRPLGGPGGGRRRPRGQGQRRLRAGRPLPGLRLLGPRGGLRVPHRLHAPRAQPGHGHRQGGGARGLRDDGHLPAALHPGRRHGHLPRRVVRVLRLRGDGGREEARGVRRLRAPQDALPLVRHHQQPNVRALVPAL